MPGCAAVGCSNSKKNGSLIKHFSNNPARIISWLANMKRDNWSLQITLVYAK